MGANLLICRVCNIGREGIFVKMSSPSLVGRAFTAQLALKEPVLLSCVVRRVELDHGLGVRIVAPGAEGRKRLLALLDTLACE